MDGHKLWWSKNKNCYHLKVFTRSGNESKRNFRFYMTKWVTYMTHEIALFIHLIRIPFSFNFRTFKMRLKTCDLQLTYDSFISSPIPHCLCLSFSPLHGCEYTFTPYKTVQLKFILNRQNVALQYSFIQRQSTINKLIECYFFRQFRHCVFDLRLRT